MSEPSTNTPSPDGLIGRATALGALRSDFNHHREDQSGAFANLRSEQDERDEATEARISELEARHDELVEILENVVATMTEYASRNPPAPSKAQTRSGITSQPAERGDKETNKAYYTRLRAWSKETGVSAPPETKPLANTSQYNARVEKWLAEIKG